MKKNSKTARPFVFLNVASTADGKLAPANRKFVPFSSKRDQELLLRLRTRADAVMSGARTVDSTEVTLGPGGERFRKMRRRAGRSEYNLRVVVSGRGSLDPDAAIFKHSFSPLIVLCSQRAPKRNVERFRAMGAVVGVFGKKEIDFAAALKWLYDVWKVRTLLCEGGGEINEGLLRAGLVDEIYLTLCPVVFGGRSAPTMADGEGIEKLSDAIPLELKSMKRVGGELYLVYRVKRAGGR
jgi:2,5-diamino-6-(ribosylamino)-4(3H)-pyrimidinone 5'-phosphate reductase